MSAHRRRNDQYTIGWVCALPIELAAAQEMLDDNHNSTPRHVSDSNIYTLGRIGKHNVVITCLPYSQMGTNSAAAVAAQMKSDFPMIETVLMVGIGGGVPRTDLDIRLGDVVVSRPNESHGGVIQYDFGKTTQNGFQRTRFLNNPPTLLLNAIANLEATHSKDCVGFLDYVSQLNKHKVFQRETAGSDILFEAHYNHVGGDTCVHCDKKYLVERALRDKQVMVHYGTVASGNQVMKNAAERDRMSFDLGGVLCFEMEAAGLMNDFPCLVIRGICDYADSHKNKDWQGYAAGIAAAYAKELLSKVPHIEDSSILPDSTNISDTLSQLPYAVDAPFNCYKRRNDPVCLPNTRVDVLNNINEWIKRQDQQYLFWLNGLAGTGKSTIARTVARQSLDAGYLGASFFFSKSSGDVGIAEKFVTSIARQLASHSSTLEERICESIKQHQNIFNWSLSDQWYYLVMKPLADSCDKPCPPYFVIVIDALDECDNEHDIMTILQLFGEAQSTCIRLRFLLTSRPEASIRRVFHKLQEHRYRDFALHEIASETSQDLAIFFTEKLAEIAETHDLDDNWPGSTIIQKLVDSAGGLFIWAATACRFIDNGKQFAGDRLSTLLQSKSRGNETQQDEPQKHLDKIYDTVFTHSISSNYNEVERSVAYSLLRYVLGTVNVLFSQLSTNSIAILLSISKSDIERILKNLQAILILPENLNSPLQLHHPSLRDFMLDDRRCTNPELYIDEKEAHRKVLINCIRVMSGTLKKNICCLSHPGTLLYNISSGAVEGCLPVGIQYACLYWVRHLIKSNYHTHDNDFIHEFLKTHLLHWIESLSLMEKIPEGILALKLLHSHASNSDCSELCNFVKDATLLLESNQICLQQMPLQVYFGALLFAGGQSAVRNHFREQPLKHTTPLTTKCGDWSAYVQTFDGHSGLIRSVAFSADGMTLASASSDKTIRLWDPVTGQCLHTLEGHSRPISAIVFSSDVKMLASASWDKTICLWNPATGQCLQTLKGHTDLIGSIAFRADTKMLASASWDKTIRLWDPITGQCLHTLEGHTRSLSAIVFRADGRVLASASRDRTICLWDLTTAQCLQTLEGHCDLITSISFSNDSKMLASASYDETIRIWDMATGHCLQILNVYGNVKAMEFGKDGSYLSTNCGFMPLHPSILDNNEHTGRTQQLLQEFSIVESWITLNNINFVWIPPGYRAATASTIKSNMIALGYSSGHVVSLIFSPRLHLVN